MLLAAALLRRESPRAKLTPLNVEQFLIRNQEEIRVELVRCGAIVLESRDKPTPIPDCFWGEAADLIRSQSGQRPSEPTIRRWCNRLGIPFSSPAPIKGEHITRLIDYCKLIRVQQRVRARSLAQSRKNRAA